MSENSILEEKAGRQWRDFKTKILDNYKTDDVFKKSVDANQTIVFTDKSTSYVNISYYVEIYPN